MAEQFIESTLMDGYVGGPHITETQTGLANQGLYGQDDYVLSAGRKAEAQILTNNSIRIFDAVFVIQGRRDVIAANDYTDVSIDNGAQGMNRNDIIVRRYTKDESSEIENTEYAVIKGTPTSGEAEDPAVTTGDIRSGALEHEMKLYRVKLEGLNIVAVEPLFQVLMDMSTLNAYLAELHNNMVCGDFSTSDEIDTGEKWVDGKRIYRRTYITTDTVSPDNTLTIPLTLSGIADTLWIDTQNSYIRSADGGQSYPLPLPRYSGTANYVGVWCNSAGIRIFSDSGWNESWEKCVTVRYTKV